MGSASQALTKQSGKNSPLGRSKTSKNTKQVSMPASFSSSSGNMKVELYSDGSLYETITESTDSDSDSDSDSESDSESTQE